MDNVYLSLASLACVAIAYIIKAMLMDNNIGKVLIFWSITLVVFANLSLTTWLTTKHDTLEKIMLSCIFFGPLVIITLICRIKKTNFFSLLIEEKKELKKSLPSVLYYLLYTVLTLGIILLVTFSVLQASIFPDSIMLAITVNGLAIALDWSIFSLLIIEIMTNSKHEEQPFFWLSCLIAGLLFFKVQHNIHVVDFWLTPAVYATLNSICCSTAALIAIGWRKFRFQETKKAAQWSCFFLIFLFSYFSFYFFNFLHCIAKCRIFLCESCIYYS